MKGKFFCFGTQISSKFAGGSGAEACLPAGRLNRILEKSSSLVVNPHIILFSFSRRIKFIAGKKRGFEGRE